MTKQELYFIAIVLPEPLASRVTDLKHVAREQFASGHALNAPPHITVIPPFRMTREDASVTESAMCAAAVRCPVPVLNLNGFGAFSDKVIYVNVEQQPDLLSIVGQMQKALRDAGIDFREDKRPYHPHVTVAFRDLRPERFHVAWQYFSERVFQGAFRAERISLLRHVQGKWDVCTECALGSASDDVI